MLYFEGLVTQGTKSANMTVDTLFSDPFSGMIRMVANDAEVQAGTGPLVYLEFLVLIGDQQATPVSMLPWFDFYSGKSRVYSRRDGSFTLIDYCDYGGRRFVRGTNGLRLSQNRPNPFNPSTVIEYVLPSDGFVELVVHDTMGRVVVTVVHETQAAGLHTVQLDAGDLHSGMYFYTLRHSAGQLTRTMLLSK
jgi:hypothetical protein